MDDPPKGGASHATGCWLGCATFGKLMAGLAQGGYMSKGILWGVGGAVVALAIFLAGVGFGNDMQAMESQSYINSIKNTKESPQMQCIHWVNTWKGLDGGGPVFGMYTALCGKPDASHQ